MANKAISIALIGAPNTGAPNTGKSTYVRRLKFGEFQVDHCPTTEATMTPVVVKCSGGLTIRFDIIEIPSGHPAPCTDATIEMITSSAPETMDHLRLTPRRRAPYVIVDSKVDIREDGCPSAAARDIVARYKTELGERLVDSCSISAKNQHNIRMPLLMVARMVLGVSALRFIDSDPVEPPHVTVPE
jgi:hypothetical protein